MRVREDVAPVDAAWSSFGTRATLELKEFGLSRSGAVLLTPLSLRSDAERVALVGDWQSLFWGLLGQAEVSTGSGAVLGSDVRRAVDRGVVGVALCDPPLPASFTVQEYLRHAARLTHGDKTRAAAETERVLGALGLAEFSKRPLGRLALHQRRALGIACAALGEPPVSFIETPLRDLDGASADYVARLCLEVTRHSRLVVSCLWPRTPSPERTLIEQCQHVFCLAGGALCAEGAPERVFGASFRYRLRVSGANVSSFERALSDAGVRLAAGAGGRYSVELPEAGDTSALLDAAFEAGLTVLELEPVYDPAHNEP